VSSIAIRRVSSAWVDETMLCNSPEVQSNSCMLVCDVGNPSKPMDIYVIPEDTVDVALLLSVFTGTTGNVNEFVADVATSLRLYKMAKKYGITGPSYAWIVSLLDLHIKDDPLECFAVACENHDTRMATRAITFFDPAPGPRKFNILGRSPICFRPLLAAKANPAHWDSVYVERLGVKYYARYVKAWHSVYLQDILLADVSKSNQVFIADLAKAFKPESDK
jgi:hypothetical protein